MHGVRRCSVRPGLIVRTHNRWGTATCLQRAGPAALEQVLRLSDALITDVRCGACGAFAT